METKLTRPNLSDITTIRFNNQLDYIKYLYESKVDHNPLYPAYYRVPELIQIAEMVFDEKKSNPDSLIFQVVSKVLNDIKPE